MPRGPLWEHRNSPAAAPPPLNAPDMHPPTCRALAAEPSDPTLLGRTRKRNWQEGGTYSEVSLVSTESELGTLPVSAFELRALHARSGLGRSAVLHRTHSSHVPLSVPAHCTTRKRRWQEGGVTHSCTRLVSAESELGTLPFSALLVRPLHTPRRTRPLGQLYYAAPTAAMCPYGTRAPYPHKGCPLSTAQSHRVPEVPL